jgi:hypothetical protein
MGGYWSCVPMKVGVNRLKRPVACLENKEGALIFNKLVRKRRQKVRKYRDRE